MTTIAHALSASYIALNVAGVDPSQTSLLIAAVTAASVIDLDHLYYILRDHSIAKKGNLHKARSIFHELIGFVVAGVLMLICGLFNKQLAIVIGLSAMIHLAEDMLVGVSMPFSPFDKTKVKLLPQNMKLKIILDVLTIIIFGVLWIKYLNELV